VTDPHRRFFAGWSRFYERTPLVARLLRKQQDEALRRLAPLRGERVLDLGCGTGRALQLVRGAVGADASLEMLRQGPRGQTTCARAEALVFGMSVHLHQAREWLQLLAAAGFARATVEQLSAFLLGRVSLCIEARAG
jgi:SAM-dependent methyltransferase